MVGSGLVLGQFKSGLTQVPYVQLFQLSLDGDGSHWVRFVWLDWVGCHPEPMLSSNLVEEFQVLGYQFQPDICCPNLQPYQEADLHIPLL